METNSKEYNPELINIQGYKYIAADALSRLDIVDTNNPIKLNSQSLFFRKRECSTPW